MREVVIPRQKTERGVQGPAPAAPAPVPAPALPAKEGRPRRRSRRGPRLRDYLVSYDGRFIGHFRARHPLPPRLAFGQIARELRSKLVHFLPEKMALHRPVKLRVSSPSEAEASARGDFSWFED